MYAKKSLALALCLAITGCATSGAQDAKSASADSSYKWWPFGSSNAMAKSGAEQAPENDVEQAVKARVAQAEAKPAPVAQAANAKGSENPWWWPFGAGESTAKAEAAKPVAAVPKVDPVLTQAFLDQYEPKVREAIKGSKFQVERRDDVLVVTAPVDASFNPDRPAMLLPAALGPITNVAKLLEPDQQGAVLILGHADAAGAADVNKKLSLERAQSVAAIFRLSGLERTRLSLRGMGSLMPRAANDSAPGRALNRRVEMIVTPQNTMIALMAKYDLPPTAVPQMVAMQDVKAEPEPVAKPASTSKKTVAAKKAAPTKKVATKATAAKKAAAKKPVVDQQASN
ncbi:OmpA family protein [Pseudomonas typographi]|uniref:OmpA family protein n=1 Tax=Pseudomonas typographi TaxID=2715964 RepID=A0ABR7Z8F0_9PSED|nr:OmpA family protein [Pseudomonas typographi]MBD1554218.1 OmpA family protein [Pseudomonas typographi]MBD1586676.1 OmpA family protein [Pseudomonas typographi]MBD1601672.1 OmpA family protein [Pseudomonas typographi]